MELFNGLMLIRAGLVEMLQKCYVFSMRCKAMNSVHVIGKKVDTGQVIHQVVPELKRGDGLHDVACRACLAAYQNIGLVLDNVKSNLDRKVQPVNEINLERSGKLFKKRNCKDASKIINLIQVNDLENAKLLSIAKKLDIINQK